MEMKFAQCVNKGMQRDYSMNTASQEFAYENKNIRITTTGNESFLAVSNEKSTIPIKLQAKGLPYRDESREEEIKGEILEGHKLCFINVKQPTEIIVYFSRVIYYPDSSPKLEQEIPHKVLVTPGIEEVDEYGNKILVTYTDITGNFNELLNVEGADEVYILGFYFITLNGYIPIGENEFSYSNFFNNAIIYGSTICGEYLVLFTRVSGSDLIFRAKIDSFTSQANTLYCELVYSGKLDFNYNMEFTTYYESDDVQKVYWVDGKKQPRVINICKLHQTSYTTNLDFVPKIDTLPIVTVEKQYNGMGIFPTGVIQYYITYYNKFGQESNTVSVTPLYNLSPSDRGGAEDETQTCSFKIRIENVDSHYDNIRIYSLIRTSLNTTPMVSIVGDLDIIKENPEQYYEIVDDNYGNINVAPSDILFLGGNTITASTIEQKDNTLFLGNISSIANNDDYTDLKEKLKTNRESGEDGISFVSRPIADKETSNADYGYSPNMDSSSKDRGFKYLEYYRFGLQFQSETGEWGNTLWLNDKQNTVRPNSVEYDETEDIIIKELYDKADNFHSLAAVKYKPTEEVKNIIKNYNSKHYRLVMAEHNDSTRTIKTQGIVMPTLFNLKQRYDNTVFGSSIWSVGMLANKEHYQNIDADSSSIYLENEKDVYIQNHPFQQLSSALYPLHSEYPNDPNVNEHKVKSKIRLSASYSKDSIGSDGYYVASVEIRIQVRRLIPGKYEIWGSPHGNFVIQDVFDFHMTPIIKHYKNTDFEVKLNPYILREFRLAGKRKDTYSYLFSLAATKTWRDYLDNVSTDEQFLSAFILNNPIIYINEIPSATDFHNRAGQGWHDESHTISRTDNSSFENTLVDEYQNNYFIDANTCNMWSPNIESLENTNLNFRVVGGVHIENTISDYNITLQQNVFNGKAYEQYEGNFNRYKYNDLNTGISSFPLWPDGEGNLFWCYPWGQSTIGKSDSGKISFNIKDKTFANLWKTSSSYCEVETYKFAESSEFTDDTKNLFIVDYGNIPFYKCEDSPIYINDNLYSSNYQNVLFLENNRPIYLKAPTGNLTTSSDFNMINSLIKDNYNVATIEEANLVKESVNIKYKSTPHLMFNLGTSFGYVETLPSYDMKYPLNSHYDENGDYIIDRINSISGNTDLATTAIYPTVTGDTYRRAILRFKNNDMLSSYIKMITECLNTEITIVCDTYLNIIKINDKSCDLKWTLLKGRNLNYLSVGDFFVTPYLYHEVIKNEYDTNTKQYIITVIPKFLGRKVFKVEGKMWYFNGKDFKEFEYCDDTLGYYIWYEETEKLTSPKWILTQNSLINKYKIFLGEFYANYDPSTFMGGNTENALEQNTFIPISDPTPIGETIYGFEGDTYYQQWDCLRIYPTSEEDTNKVVDIVSVMLETHENLDGDTRKARGRADVVNVRPDNMVNQINPVYSQSNNYITSKILDEKFEDSTHPTQYWWSLTKTPNADIDTWTGVNLTSVAELDGDKGPLNKIKRWNNKLFAFQDKAIAMINFNNQTTIATQEGIPVEISNSGKVNGHYYITTNNGCSNKESIVESPNGLYFIDNYNTSISVIGDDIKSLSQLNLFQDWLEQVEKDPYRIANHLKFKGFYDPIHKEIYYADGIDCICYNELLQQFTSFYDYQTMRNMFAANGHVYAITSKDKMYKMFEGDDYCKLFDTQCDYYMQYKINNEPFIDKTWTNLEYRADIFDRGNIQTNEFATNDIITNETFDSLKVWNEYQNGELDLTKVRFGYLKDAKPKFRIWRTNLPRAKTTDTNKFGLDRIRNPWIMLELRKSANSETSTNKRMEFHDLIVKYVI